MLDLQFPRLDALQYKPKVSVKWDGDRPHFFLHGEMEFRAPISEFPGLILEWHWYRVRLFSLAGYFIVQRIGKEVGKAVSPSHRP
jgi:hypothetical protein